MARPLNNDEESVRDAAGARADREAAVAAIREGLADAEAGRVKPAREALKMLAKKYSLPDR